METICWTVSAAKRKRRAQLTAHSLFPPALTVFSGYFAEALRRGGESKGLGIDRTKQLQKQTTKQTKTDTGRFIKRNFIH